MGQNELEFVVSTPNASRIWAQRLEDWDRGSEGAETMIPYDALRVDIEDE